MRPKLLDLYCCEGGAARGYDMAGFDVYGVDLFTAIEGGFSRKRYPYPSVQGDVLLVMAALVAGDSALFTTLNRMDPVCRLGLDDFAVIHASPPCQHASAGTRAMRAHGDDRHPALVEPTRDLLRETGLPYVIENVKGAALRNPVALCGCMFDLTARDADGLPLRLERERLFESNMDILAPRPCDHDPDVWVAGAYGGGRKAKRLPGETLAEVAPRDRHEAKYVRKGGYVPRSMPVLQALLGIDWMTKGGMNQAIPPAYTEWIGWQLRVALARDIRSGVVRRWKHEREGVA